MTTALHKFLLRSVEAQVIVIGFALLGGSVEVGKIVREQRTFKGELKGGIKFATVRKGSTDDGEMWVQSGVGKVIEIVVSRICNISVEDHPSQGPERNELPCQRAW